MQKRLLTDDEINDARAMVGWEFWAAPTIFGVATLALGIGALGGSPPIIFIFLIVFTLTVILCFFRFLEYERVSHDIETRVVEVMEGAAEKVWVPRNAIELTKSGFCYLRLAGCTIRVPTDLYRELRETNIVKVAFLPTAMVAVRVEPGRGLGL